MLNQETLNTLSLDAIRMAERSFEPCMIESWLDYQTIEFTNEEQDQIHRYVARYVELL